MDKYCKYKKYRKYVSYDDGKTLQPLEEYIAGELIERNSADCGYVQLKFKATYSDGSVLEVACNDDGELTSGETNPRGYDYAKMTTAEIGDCVSSIDWYAFISFRSLRSINIPDSVTSIGTWAFNRCVSLTSVTIPDSVTVIGSGAFETCKSLTRVHMGSGVTNIVTDAFNGCSGLTSIDIPDSVTVIGRGVLSYCTSMTSVQIGAGIKTMGEYVFRYSNKITSITILAETPPDVENNTFNDINNNFILYVPDDSVDAYKSKWGFYGYTSRIKPLSEKP